MSVNHLRLSLTALLPGAAAAKMRPGELAHAERDVPAAQRQAVFGTTADTFAGLGVATSLCGHLEGAHLWALPAETTAMHLYWCM